MPINHIVVARHGHGFDLSKYGIEQAERLGAAIKAELEGKSKIILCTKFVLARQTAVLISHVMRHPKPVENLATCDVTQLQELGEKFDHEAEAVILVLTRKIELENFYRWYHHNCDFIRLNQPDYGFCACLSVNLVDRTIKALRIPPFAQTEPKNG